MPFANYTGITAYADANFPEAFRALPDPHTYATIKPSPLGPRVKVGHSLANPQSSVWVLLWSQHGHISFIDGDRWIPIGNFRLDEPYSELWDGVVQENALGHPAIFDVFIRYRLMATGHPGYLQFNQNPLRYHFQPIFWELCEEWVHRSAVEVGDGTGSVSTEELMAEDTTDTQQIRSNSSMAYSHTPTSSVKLDSLHSELERLMRDFKAFEIHHPADREA